MLKIPIAGATFLKISESKKDKNGAVITVNAKHKIR